MSTTSDATIRSQARIACLLAMVAGYVDAYTLVTYRVYASFMSGNTTQTGLNAGQARFLDAAHHLLPIPLFVIGVFVGTLVLHTQLQRPTRRICGLVAVCLVTSAAATLLHVAVGWFEIVALSFAMGAMNTLVTRVGGQPVSLGFVTGDLNHLAKNLALATQGKLPDDSRASWDTYWFRTRILAAVWGAFLLGAALAGVSLPMLSHWMLLPPVLILVAVTLFDLDVQLAPPASGSNSGGQTAPAGRPG